MTVIYKTLFEIKLLHEYFLTGQDGKSIFHSADLDSRLEYLSKQFALNKEPVNAHVSFEFPESLKLLYDSSFLKLVPSYSGCKVAIKVQRITKQDGSIGFRPQVAMGEDMDIFILIRKKTGLVNHLKHFFRFISSDHHDLRDGQYTCSIVDSTYILKNLLFTGFHPGIPFPAQFVHSVSSPQQRWQLPSASASE